MELSRNQSAIILEASDDGEITVDIASSNHTGLAGTICQAIAAKLMSDESFQAEIMQMVDNNSLN